MKVTRAAILRNLPKKGFRKESRHHIYFYYEYKGMETGAYTYISHSAKQKDVSGDLFLSMRKQLKLEAAIPAAKRLNILKSLQITKKSLRRKL